MTRDEPQTADEAIALLHAELRALTDAYEDLLENGQPALGSSIDDANSRAGWHERAHDRIVCARWALDVTSNGLPPPVAPAAAAPDGKSIATLLQLIGDYWDLAYREGFERRLHDTKDGAATQKWNEIRHEAMRLAGPPLPGAETKENSNG